MRSLTLKEEYNTSVLKQSAPKKDDGSAQFRTLRDGMCEVSRWATIAMLLMSRRLHRMARLGRAKDYVQHFEDVGLEHRF
jgi:hypothetical protein